MKESEKSRYHCLIVDDEFPARKLLLDYTQKIEDIAEVNTCKNGMEALSYMKQQHVDLLLLDIQMPDITGVELLKILPYKPVVIMTTAYSDYAVEGYELGVFDYLLKPIPFPKFLQTINRAIQQLEDSHTVVMEQKETEIRTGFNDYLIVKADHKLFKINFEDLLYIEGQREYVTFHTKNRKITAFYSLKSLEQTLPSDLFIRIHKSFIVSIKHIEIMEGNVLQLNGAKLPIGKSFKENVNKVFNL